MEGFGSREEKMKGSQRRSLIGGKNRSKEGVSDYKEEHCTAGIYMKGRDEKRRSEKSEVRPD